MSIKKKLTMAVAVVLIIAMAIAGTYAYLTSQATVSNTFTIGKISITLDEAEVDEDGKPIDGADRVVTNAYKLMPGHEYKKDPIIHVAKDSEACWLFVKVEDELAAIEADDTIDAQILANGWTALSGQTGVYYKDQAAVTTDTDVAVFSTLKIKGDVADISGYENATIDVTAYAIQKDGLASADDAWAALNPSTGG